MLNTGLPKNQTAVLLPWKDRLRKLQPLPASSRSLHENRSEVGNPRQIESPTFLCFADPIVYHCQSHPLSGCQKRGNHPSSDIDTPGNNQPKLGGSQQGLRNGMLPLKKKTHHPFSMVSFKALGTPQNRFIPNTGRSFPGDSQVVQAEQPLMSRKRLPPRRGGTSCYSVHSG